jgi:hypothetical protein
MKIRDQVSKRLYMGTLFERNGDKINVFNRENDLIASIPASQAKLIFNENEIPYMEEVK